MQIMVTGSRFWTDRSFIHDTLRAFAHLNPEILHGDCAGADHCAEDAADTLGLASLAFPPDKSKPIPQRYHDRNDAMLAKRPDVVLAFRADGEKNAGTNSVIRKARALGLNIVTFDRPQA